MNATTDESHYQELGSIKEENTYQTLKISVNWFSDTKTMKGSVRKRSETNNKFITWFVANFEKKNPD